jgi:predicted nucleic acid-binding Zn ribbon protein
MLSPDDTNKHCLTCGRSIKGRSDKKYCDEACRNSYNNHWKKERNNFIRRTNSTLLKNRRILERLLPVGEEMAKTNKEKLQRLGFQFNYMTHLLTNKKGAIYHFCYDYGYLPIGKDWYLIVKNKRE